MPSWTGTLGPRLTASRCLLPAAAGTAGGRLRSGDSDGDALSHALCGCRALAAGPRRLFPCRGCGLGLCRRFLGIAVWSCGYKPRAKGRPSGLITKPTSITWNGMSRPGYASRCRTATAAWRAAFLLGSSRRRTATTSCGPCLECEPPCTSVTREKHQLDTRDAGSRPCKGIDDRGDVPAPERPGAWHFPDPD